MRRACGKDGDDGGAGCGGEGKRASGAATIWSKFIEIYAGILTTANYPMHTSVLEGVNNKIKVIPDYP